MIERPFKPLSFLSLKRGAVAPRLSLDLNDLRFTLQVSKGHDHTLRGPAHLNATPSGRPMWNGIGTTEGLINSHGVEVRCLPHGHVNKRQKETEALSARVNG